MTAAMTAAAPYDNLLARLTKVKSTGKRSCMACCPAHEDRTPSLSIKEGNGGTVVLTCHAGCETSDVVAALGLSMSDLFPASEVPAFRAPVPSRAGSAMVRSYDYVDADGQLLFQVCRYSPKDFRQRRRNRSGGWDWTRGDAPLVLYRLPEVLEAIALEREVYIVEGEKDAETLHELGLTATTNPGGAGKWSEDFSRIFTGARVIILPDNDERGRAHAEQVATGCTAAGAAAVKVVSLPGLPLKGDVSDWMATRSRDDFTRAIEAPTETESASPRFRLLTPKQLGELPPLKPIVDRLIYAGGFSAVIAPYSGFKSLFAIDMSLCIANGLDFHGFAVTPGLTVYQAGEGGPGLHRRVEAWRQLNGLPEVSGIYFLPQSLKLNDARDLVDLLAVLRGLPQRPVKITIDTVARSFRGNENTAEDSGLYVEAVDTIRETIGAHVQLVHHTGWEGTRSRGSTNIPSSLDTELTLARDGERLTITSTKQKDVEEYPPFTLEAVQVAGSVALRTFAPTSSKLSESERRTLQVVQDGGPLKATAWCDTVGIPRRTFFAAKSRLLSLCYVKSTLDGFAATDAGKQAI